jgi:hypothetical protein
VNEDPDILRDVADGWHVAALLGVLTPTAAALTDGVGLLLVLLALHRGYLVRAATLTATTAASVAVALALH